MYVPCQTCPRFIPRNVAIEESQQRYPRIIPHNDSEVNLTKVVHPLPHSHPHSHRTSKSKRFVQFPSNGNVSRVVAVLEPSSNMSDSERNSIWYQTSELELFKSTIRSVIKQRRSSLDLIRRKLSGRPLKPRNGNMSQDKNSSRSLRSLKEDVKALLDLENACACFRGLELRLSVQRQRNKFVAIRAVLEAQRRLRKKAALEAACGRETNKIDSDNRLALVSAKFTRSAREDAAEVGKEDFVKAYSSTHTPLSSPIYNYDPIYNNHNASLKNENKNKLESGSPQIEKHRPQKRTRFLL